MHYRIFDCWRFGAALLVMAYHFLYAAPYGAQAGTDFLRRLLPLLDMFFMISGFLIATLYADRLASGADYLQFMRRRLARLYPLHILITSFFVTLAILAWAIDAPRYPWRAELAALPQNLLLLQGLGTTDALRLNFVSWSVSAEVFSYALFPIILLAHRRLGLSGVLALLAVWVAGLEIASRAGVFPEGHWTEADRYGAYRAFADFTMGAAIAFFVAKRSIDLRSFWPGLTFLALAFVSMIAEFGVYFDLAFFAAAITATALAEGARPQATAMLAPLMPVTRVAFGVYLWHPVMEFIFLTTIWEKFLAQTGVIDFYVYWIVPMLVTIAVAIVSERTFERFAAGWINGARPARKPAVSRGPTPSAS